MKKTFVLLLVLLGSMACYAQKTLDIVSVSGHFGFPQNYEDIYEEKAKEIGGMLSLVAPIKMSEKTYWYNSVNYFYWKVNNDITMPAEVLNPMELHGFILQTGIYHKFNDRKGIQVLFAPRLMSDLTNVSGSHFQFGGTVMYEVKYREGLTISYGAMYNQELYGPYMLPVVNLDWQLNNRWRIHGLLPIYSKISYQASPNFNFGVHHFGLGSTYKLGDPEFNGDYVERRSIEAGLFGRLKLGGNIFMEGRVGYSFDRRYEQYSATDKIDFAIPLVNFGDDRVQKNVSFHDGGYANIRLVYAVELPSGN